jgi:hypothetical protein
MPRVIPDEPRFKPEDVVMAWQCSAPTWTAGPNTITPTMRLRGDHPAVLACPAYFVRADAPTAERPTVWDAVPEPPQFAPEFLAPTVEIPANQVAICTTAFSDAGGRWIKRGARLRRDDPAVRMQPQFLAVPLAADAGGNP